MASIKRFEDLTSLQKALDFTCSIFEFTKEINDQAFNNQIIRATYSISNNIAEGFERGSNKEFRRYLIIAKASNGEVRSMLHVARRIGYLNEMKFKELKDSCLEISKLIGGMTNYLETSTEKPLTDKH